MVKIVIGLLMLTVLSLFVLLLLIIGLSIALLVFSRKGGKEEQLSVKKEPHDLQIKK